MHNHKILKTSTLILLSGMLMSCETDNTAQKPVPASYVVGADKQRENAIGAFKARQSHAHQEKQQSIIREFKNAPVVEVPTEQAAVNQEVRVVPPASGIKMAKLDFSKNNNASILMVENRILYPYGVGALPVFLVPDNSVADIQLERGEVINSYSMSDTHRWKVSEVIYGAPGGDTPHFSIKPIEKGIKNSLIIYTNRRTYSITLSTANQNTTNLFGFYYPYEGLGTKVNSPKASGSANALSSGGNVSYNGPTMVQIDDISFGWKWRGDEDLPWYPRVVFDDGEKTFIELNKKEIKASKLPVFFVMSEEGETEVVNYRYKPPYLIIDQVFERGVLLRGVGDDQERITITRKS